MHQINYTDQALYTDEESAQMQINADKIAVASMKKIFTYKSKKGKKKFEIALKKDFLWLLDPSTIALQVLSFSQMKVKHKSKVKTE